jgi:hydroxymethylglutaryl-CoA lyase
VATEDVVYLLNGLGLKTGVSLDKLIDVGDYISKQLNRVNASRAGSALLKKR